jgi:hypothetical protein
LSEVRETLKELFANRLLAERLDFPRTVTAPTRTVKSFTVKRGGGRPISRIPVGEGSATIRPKLGQ